MESRYKILEHTADLKIRSFGKDLKELFSNTAFAMTEFIYGENLAGKTADKKERIEIKSKDRESLLVDWLSEILYLSNANRMAYIGYDIKEITDVKITAEVFSCEAKAAEDIKAATFNDLEIKQQEDGNWTAVVVYDI
ncbi:archease [Candidatus Azambacteria bacterium]|nr:archease [Candidatus Azambacteria bacterium]